jgi:hypothetical protein
MHLQPIILHFHQWNGGSSERSAFEREFESISRRQRILQQGGVRHLFAVGALAVDVSSRESDNGAAIERDRGRMEGSTR